MFNEPDCRHLRTLANEKFPENLPGRKELTMNKINPIFEALSGVDERHIPVTQVKRSLRKPIMLAAAATAAALALAVGIRNWSGVIGNYISPADPPVNQGGVSYEASGFGESEASLPDDSVSNQIVIPEDFTPLKLNIPDDFYKYGEIVKTEAYEKNKIHYGRGYTFHYDDISSMFDEFGFSPLINENFTEEGVEPLPYIFNEDEPLVFVSEIIDVPDSMRVNFNYNLYDKSAGKLIHFSAVVISGKSDRDYYIDLIKNHCPYKELIALNDGSICGISYDEALFFHNSTSTYYNIAIYEPEKEKGCSTIKQVLADIGVL